MRMDSVNYNFSFDAIIKANCQTILQDVLKVQKHKTRPNITLLSIYTIQKNFSKKFSNLPITTLSMNLCKQRKLQREHSHLIIMSAVSDNEERTIFFKKNLYKGIKTSKMHKTYYKHS